VLQKLCDDVVTKDPIFLDVTLFDYQKTIEKNVQRKRKSVIVSPKFIDITDLKMIFSNIEAHNRKLSWFP
jgi:hypothetical protein